MVPRATMRAVALLGVLGLGGAAWWWTARDDAQEATELPVPPFPPRITDGRDYEACLASLAEDPAGAAAMAEAWQVKGGGDGARHCQALALIALGHPEEGAALLEALALSSPAPALARATLLGQAGQARLMVAQADRAADDASQGLVLSPDGADLFIIRAQAKALLNRYPDAIADLDQALARDPQREDALLARAVTRRKLGQLDQAQADVTQALTLNPDDGDALLERGILRQRLGDRDGARQDWEHARDVDPNGPVAELAAQNLSLLEAGPEGQ
jgi:tetratricopeptide (TPR) repeat protein